MEGLTNEMERVLSLSHDHNQDQGEKESKGSDKGKKKKGGSSDGYNGGGGMLRTPADIYDHPTSYSFILDMPGVDSQNIKVKVENGILHVTGKRKKIKQIEEGAKALRLERRKARYMRKFTLPTNASEEDVKAAYKDGVLTITLSKTLLP